ncbi:hypothetical protein MUN78_00315 [Leucobacter allii]|uniref:Nucleotidyltransferase n=1 Tax=Leucobacter allii TaxID=2932247 RepID=A0ABY4FM57_9MICO|nr:hypothetical protein [Leucobacter allii]UOQ57323.1 hypothetical protein MUN78_00315 [Leucobacter allii]UOR01772.1 hypothetical protein MUN77_00130 [Leucobacter allii]
MTGESTFVWMEQDRPARLVYERARWRVVGTPRAIIEAPEEERHPLAAHPRSRQTEWRCTVRRDGDGETRTLALRRDGSRWDVRAA